MAICEGVTIPELPVERLPGHYLFLAGSNFCNRLNSPARHLPRHLGTYVEQLDTVGYTNFYGGPPAPAWRRLSRGIRNILSSRLQITQQGTNREILARRLHMPGPLEMILEDLWIYAILRPVLARVYDVGVVGHPDNALLAALLKRTGRVRCLVYNDWDYYPGYVDRHWSSLIAWRERVCIHAADGVVSVSRPLAALREQQGARCVGIVPNGVDFQRFNEALLHREPHSPTLFYCGSLDVRWGVDLAIRALPLLRNQLPGIRFLIAGQGPAEKELKNLAKARAVSDAVHFAGVVDYQDLPGLMAQADIGVATSRQDAFRQYASPLKLVEYMAAGLPIICSGGGEAEQMVKESGAGVHISFTDQAFAQATLSILGNPYRWASLRQAGLNYARVRSWDHLGARLAGFIAELSGQSTTLSLSSYGGENPVESSLSV